MSLQIRSATKADVPQILEFIKALAEYEKLAHEVVATEDKLRQTLFPESGSDKSAAAEVLIATWNGEAAGFALFFSNYSTFLAKPGIYLEDLFVLPHMRSHGIGKALLLHLARLAVQRDGGRLEWSVLDWNTPAIEFYLKLGAKRMEEWTVHRVSGEGLQKLALM